MRPITLAICAGFALSPVAATAAPTPGGAAADARCLMTMAALTSSKDEAQSRSAQVGVIFFAGRVKGQDPTYDFSTRLKTVATGMDRDTIIAEAKRCGPILTTALQQLDAAQKTFPAPKPAAAPAGKPAPKPAPKP